MDGTLAAVEPVAYDRFYSYGDLTALLRSWAEAAPQLFQLESIGRSYEGRDIWLATVTNTATGAHDEKPAFLVEAQIHSVEWTGTTAALHLLHKLLTEYGSDARVTKALDTRTFYVIPRLNPDGAEHALEERRFIRSSVRPYPRPEPEDGLHPGDVDGDGRVLTMRIEDPNGPWKPLAQEPRLLVRRDPLDDEGPFYRLYAEGRVRNYDGVTIKVSPPLEGLDLNRNFPADWAQEVVQKGAGPFPMSEPESRAFAQAVVERPNVCAHVAYHTFSGVHLRPYAAHPDEHFPTRDLEVYELVGAEATRLTGYPAFSVFHGFKYDPKEPIHGGLHDWLYDHVGVFSWTTEFWSPPRQAGITPEHYTNWIRDHPPEDDLELLRWYEHEYPGRAYVDWYEFDHPDLGRVELGGWDNLNYWFNVPFDRLEAEVAPHSELALFQLLTSPLLEWRSVDVEAGGEGVHLIRAVVANTGWLPTNVTQQAVERQTVRPLEVEIRLPDGARLLAGEPKVELGQLEGRAQFRSTMWWNNDPSTNDLAKLEWVVEAPSGTEVELEARHDRAGTVRRTLSLRA